MENPFENLIKRIDKLESLLKDIDGKLSLLSSKADKGDDCEIGDIEFASKITGLAIPTIYTKSSRHEIPCMKQGKKLFFSKAELLEWIKSGRKKMMKDYLKEVDGLLSKKHKM